MRKILKAKDNFEKAGYTYEELMQMQTCSVKNMYHILQGYFNKVRWRKLVCNNASRPRWVFMLTLMDHSRLYTKDRLLKWGIHNDQLCPLCSYANESIQHLFFEFQYAVALWKRLLNWQGIHRSIHGWSKELRWAENWAKNRSAKAELFKMVLAGYVYFVWQERNARLFQAKSRNCETLSKLIIQEVHSRNNIKIEKILNRLDYYPMLIVVWLLVGL
ncbi:uncharacterized protein LOC142175823 [Nicotiana tabacum]|uniref:Uncharacterized protein LOC142175823 n=1 Tax=Nicotiana tabacum TaxID=4097 RepID=A0AC58TNY2_TOBAC